MERNDSSASFATAQESNSNTSFGSARSDSNNTASSGSRELRAQPSDVQEVAIILANLARIRSTGTELQNALKADPRLRRCIENLRTIRLPDQLQEKLNHLLECTWLYLDADFVVPVIEELEKGVFLAGKKLLFTDLRAWHVVAGPGYYEIVQKIIDYLPARISICRTAPIRAPIPYQSDGALRVVPSPHADSSVLDIDSSVHESGQASDLVQLPSIVQIDTDDEMEIIPVRVAARSSLGVTGSHITSHRLETVRTFIQVKLSGTSAGKFTWPLRKKDEERASKRMRGGEYHSEAAASSSHACEGLSKAAAPAESSQSLGGFTEYFETQEMQLSPIPEAPQEMPQSGDIPEVPFIARPDCYE